MSVTLTGKTLTETVVGLKIVNGVISVLEVAFVDGGGVERRGRAYLSLVNGQLIDQTTGAVVDASPPAAYVNAYSSTMPSAITTYVTNLATAGKFNQ